MMKVLHIIDEYFPPEKGYSAPYYYCIALQACGFEVTVLCGRRLNEAIIENINGITIVRTRGIFNWGRRWDRLKLLMDLLRNYKYFKKIHLWHVYYSHVSPMIHLIALVLRVKSICDIRSVPLKRSTIGRYVRLISAQLASHTAVIDKFVGQEIRFSKRRENQLSIFPLGVNIEQFKCPSDSGGDGAYTQFVSVGSIDKLRKQEDIIDAVKLLKDAGVGEQFRVRIVGGGDSLDNIASLAEQLEVSELVEFVGLVKPSEVASLLCRADVGICYLPIARYDCQPPTKTIEYLAAGLKVVATKTSANRELLSQSAKDCVQMCDDNPVDLSRAMLTFVQSATKARCSTMVAREMDWKCIVNKSLIPVYSTLLGQRVNLNNTYK